MKLYIVGQHRKTVKEGAVWDFQGVFESKELAIKACRSSAYFVASIELNKECPDEAESFPEIFYPLRHTM